MTEKYPVLPEEDDYAKYPAPVAEDDDYAKYPVQPQEPAGNTPAAVHQQSPAPKQQSSLRSVKLMLGLVLLLILAIAAYVLLRYFGVIDTTQEGQHAVRSYRAPVQNTSADETDTFPAAVEQDGVVDAETSDALDYTIHTYSNGTCEITQYTGTKTNLSIPNTLSGYTVTAIGEYAFYGTAVESVSLPTGITRIGECAFGQCTALTSVFLPSTVTVIEKGAFRDCSVLTMIRLPDNLTTIGEGAFSHCEALTSIRIPAAVTSIGEYAFRNCHSVQSYTVDAGNSHYSSVQHCLLANDGAVLLNYPAGRSARSFTVPATVTNIRPYAFENAKLATIIISEGTKAIISGYAFYHCTNLQDLHCPANVIDISYYAIDIGQSVTLHVEPGSYAERFALRYDFNYVYLP